MGRLSIYLPDELEARAKALQPDTPTSQIVRAALERYIGTADKPAYAQEPEDVGDLLSAGVEHFKALAIADYQQGYRAALTRLPDLDWAALADFAKDGFDLHKWLAGWSTSVNYGAARNQLAEYTPDWFTKMAQDVGSLANPIGFDPWNFRKTPPFERGYADGLRAGYEAALEAGVMTAAAAPVPAADTSHNVDDPAADVNGEAEASTA